MKFRFSQSIRKPSERHSNTPDSLDALEMYFVTTTEQQYVQAPLKLPGRICHVAQILLLFIDAVIVGGILLGAGTLAPHALDWPVHMACGLGLFLALAMYCGLYNVRNSYYVLGKLCPLAVLFGLLEALSWSQWHLSLHQTALLSSYSALGLVLMMVSHHWITRPFSQPNKDSIYYRIELHLKRLMDIILASATLIALSPLLTIVAFVVWREDPSSSCIFTQPRIGLKGHPFVIYKFRTMKAEAEKEIQHILSKKNLSLYKMKSDPRITTLGRWLRNTSIDELPQLLNILKGDMSIVGPRPFVIREQEMMPRALQRLRSRMAPGLTCLWQIDGRIHGHRDFETVVMFDTAYIDNWNLMRDILIILKTVPVVLLQKGCY